jgi:O-antigen ligase
MRLAFFNPFQSTSSLQKNSVNWRNMTPQLGPRFDVAEYVFQIIVTVSVAIVILVHSSTPVTFAIKLLSGPASWLGYIWYFGALLSLSLAVASPFRTLKASLYAIPFVIITLWCWATIFWTVDLDETVKGCVLVTCGLIGAASIAVRYDWLELTRFMAWILTGLIAISVLLAIGVPSLGKMKEIYPGAWSGLFSEKQALGFSAVLQIIFVTVLGVYSKEHRAWLWAIPIGIIAIIGTQGKTALIMTFTGFAIVFGAKLLQTDRRIMLITVWLGVVCTGILALILFLEPDIVFKLTGKSSDFTGRKEIWEGIDYLVRQKPQLGWGYSVIWNDIDNPTSPYQWIAEIADFKPSNAHSSYKEAILSIGSVGLWMLIFLLGKFVFDCLIRLRTDQMGATLSLAVICSLLVISSTETVFIGKMDLYWFLTMLLGIKIAMPTPKNPKSTEKPNLGVNQINATGFYTY